MFQTSRPGRASRAPISGGQASPPRISSRTASIASAGHSATSVGTVDTMVTALATIHGPRSVPLRTRDRGAGTRHAPYRHANHISSHEASNATDSPAITRSPGPIGSSSRNIRDSASTNAAAERCETATPFGVPVDPEVKITHTSSSSAGSARSTGSASPRAVITNPDPITAATPASSNTTRARASGSSASTGT